MSDEIKKTVLYDQHVALKARMIPFGGWMMPVQYAGILAEHHQTRNAVSLFDTSHMGEFVVHGDCMETGLDRLVTMRLADMKLKTCRYGFLLNEQGTVMDDLIVYRVGEQEWFVVVNGATIEKDAAQFRAHLSAPSCFKDVSLRTGKIDVQGPHSVEMLKALVPGIDALKYYAFDFFELLGERMLISRTGYTGECGFELYPSVDKTVQVWEMLMAYENVKPAGLGARDVLRLEKGFSLYGHELSDTITPLEAGLSKFVDFEKDFIGKSALLEMKQRGRPRKCVGFVSNSRRSPREGQQIYAQSGDEIGVVTSGTFSPCLERGIGLGLIRSQGAVLDDVVFFGNEKNKTEAIIRSRTFY